jgi:hypothetical protein
LARDVNLTDKQKGVIRGVIPAAALSAVGLCGAPLLLPASALPADEPGARIAWAVQWALFPVLTLMVSVARVGNHRFYTPEDIDGSGLTSGTPRIQVLLAVLQNTLEQTVLAVTAYTIWAVVMPRSWLWSIAMAALFFVAGRIFFARGYTRGAPGRALGFGLTAYPTFGMLATLAAVLLFRLVMR